jgi:site-specific recombinase XerD
MRTIHCAEFINGVLAAAREFLTPEQKVALEGVLVLQTQNIRIEEAGVEEGKRELTTADQNGGQGYMMFFVSKKMQGLSANSLVYYKGEIDAFLREVGKPIEEINTNDIRIYLARRSGKVSNATLDNKRRCLSTFFEFLAMEEFIPKNPVKKIGTIKQSRKIRMPFDGLEIERLRDACETKRETAIIDLLLSTGMRVGELHLLNRQDVNFRDGEATVIGKGNKERTVYLNAKAAKHLQDYLDGRKDGCAALIVGEQTPHPRLGISGIETCVREIGTRAGLKNVHPHRFRRTAATMALNKGMPIEQVKTMLGHEQMNTTLRYVVIASENVKASHKKYM